MAGQEGRGQSGDSTRTKLRSLRLRSHLHQPGQVRSLLLLQERAR